MIRNVNLLRITKYLKSHLNTFSGIIVEIIFNIEIKCNSYKLLNA